MTDEPTVHSRMLSAGISEESIQRHFADGAILCDSVQVTDLEQPAPPPSRIVIGGQ